MAHQVLVEPDSLLAREIRPSSFANDISLSTIPVNSSHHQSADVAGDGLRVTARCPDDGVVEAIEGTQPGHYVLAVQWHPERGFESSQPSLRLFQSFVEAAREWQGEAQKPG